MSIGLTAQELEAIEQYGAADGDIVQSIETIDFQIAQLQLQKVTSGYDSTMYKKFYDWWTLLTTYSELEEKWTAGNYVSESVNETIIYNSALGQNTILFPYSTEAWGYLYSKRVAALNGTDSSGYGDTDSGPPFYEMVYGPYEYGQILQEEDATALNWLAPVQAQADALSDYIIPNLVLFIAEMQSESDYSTALSSLITAASTALSQAQAAYSDATNTVTSYPSYPGSRATFISTRKTQIENRMTWIHSNHGSLYDKRYLWLDVRINRSYGVYGDYLRIDDLVAILNTKKLALQNRLSEIQAII